MVAMTDEPRAPIFGFIFAPKPHTPGAPQLTWLRIPARGPWRLMLLIGSTLALAALVGSALLALAGTRSLEGLAVTSLTFLLGLPLVALIVRGWIQGTYVNDSGVRIVRMWGSEFVPWSSIESIGVTHGRHRRVTLHLVDEKVDTTIGETTLDTALRPQSWDAAVDRLRIWHRESQPPHSD